MSYQIDQSGKIEQTNKDTIVALTNGAEIAIILKKRTQRLLLEVFRTQKLDRFFPYLVFSALLALVIKEYSPKSKVIIDREYDGHEDLITERTIFYLKNLKLKNRPPLNLATSAKPQMHIITPL